MGDNFQDYLSEDRLKLIIIILFSMLKFYF